MSFPCVSCVVSPARVRRPSDKPLVTGRMNVRSSRVVPVVDFCAGVGVFELSARATQASIHRERHEFDAAQRILDETAPLAAA